MLLLPVITINILSEQGQGIPVRCLFDTGSHRTYISLSIVNTANSKFVYRPKDYLVKTFLETGRRSFGEAVFTLQLPGGDRVSVSVLADPQFNISLKTLYLQPALQNIIAAGYKLADPTVLDLVSNSSTLDLQGLIGVDVIQHFGRCDLISCMKGKAWQLSCGVVPFGSLTNFIDSDRDFNTQNCSKKGVIGVNYENFMSRIEKVPEKVIDSVLAPNKIHFSPLQAVLEDSAVEYGIESMFSLESIGCTEGIASQLDSELINEFSKGIKFVNGKYEISLIWHKHLLDSVPSNHKAALAILDKVIKSLQRNGLLQAYQEIFMQQLKDDIIERIHVDPKDYDKHIWVPHHPVIKTGENVTTRLRSVFNCSLKDDKGTSLNQVAYPGINIMANLWQLLCHLRVNKYILLSDIKSAFLNIRLAKEEDRNRFSFFMIENERLVAYRYKTIIFGFAPSPFILNYVIKAHASQFPDDECTKALVSHLYVDNLIYSTNCKETLDKLYHQCYERMLMGGFELRSWNTNEVELQSKMRQDGRLATHGSDYENVLGYKYLLNEDCIQLKHAVLDKTANTKKQIVAAINKVFDPLGLCLPVVTRGKILTRELWKNKLSWNEIIPVELQNRWKSLHRNLEQLWQIKIPRCCFLEEERSELVLFCDAAKESYGYAVYIVSGLGANLLHSVSKLAPLPEKSLATLELLAVYLALQRLPLLLDSYPKHKFNRVSAATDSQIALAWILAEDTKTKKNIFARNRVKDIAGFKKSLKQRYGVEIAFRYVKTDENPGDLITRGVSFSEFDQKKALWFHGPSWISTYPINWPRNPLECISGEHKETLNANEIVEVNMGQAVEITTVFDPKTKSCFGKLLKLTALLLKWKKCKVTDPMLVAKRYWVKVSQSAAFAKEIQYLENPSGSEVPKLVNQLDLFLDKHGIIRSRGRIGKTHAYEYEVVNPVLLPREGHITELIIMFYHVKVKHLGLQATLVALRTNGWWIPRMRQCVKGVISDCRICIRYNTIAFRYPRMTNLPEHRVNHCKPFQFTGIDFTGSLNVNDMQGEVHKYYLLIFTCLNVRAVHLELVPDMSTKQFVLAFLRFSHICNTCLLVFR